MGAPTTFPLNTPQTKTLAIALAKAAGLKILLSCARLAVLRSAFLFKFVFCMIFPKINNRFSLNRERTLTQFP